MFEKILLAVDGSDDSKAARKLAGELARRDGAKVIVVHAFPPVYPGPFELPTEKTIKEFTSTGQDVAQQAADAIEDDDVEVIVEEPMGPAADAILKVAKTHQPDLIVMGNRGHGEISSLLLGSVSHRVLAHAKAPVLVVKAE